MITAVVVTLIRATQAATLTVGNGQMYDKPSVAFAAAKDGDQILIYNEIYTDDFAVITQNSLYIRGLNGRPHITQSTTSVIPNGKALWVIQGNHITVDNIEFSNAHCQNNCEGIRTEAADTVILNSSFHHNEFGVLSAALPNVSIRIEKSEFYENGGSYTFCHQIYINGNSFTFRFNYVHHAPCDGHLIKTRASYNYILYNRISAERDDQSSYQIDIPVGGETYVIGNLVEKSSSRNNRTIIAYDEEGIRGVNPPNLLQALYLINNTIVNDGSPAIFILQPNPRARVRVENNLFVGPGVLASTGSVIYANKFTHEPFFVDRQNYDYHLTALSPAINKGVLPGKSDSGFSLQPSLQYRHPTSFETRPTARDVGAYEYAPR